MAEAGTVPGVTGGRDHAHQLFQQHHGGSPTHLSRAPGRVNLIGEHIDYNDLAVLPMALQREARLWYRARDDGHVRLVATRAEFEPVEFEVMPGIPRGPEGHWGNYVRAPAHELARRFAIWRGFDAVFDSDVPVASGLSSSSALVNAVGLALAHVNEVPVEPLAFAELMAESERYTGTRGGGMDQAISIAGRAGCAARIAFAPLQISHVPIPREWCFVVADTGVRAEKSGPAQVAYNLRRAECSNALMLVGEEAVRRGATEAPPEGYRALLRRFDHHRLLGFAEAALDARHLRRFRHVITESRRVTQAVDRLSAADLVEFGTLMDASHGSLHTDYQVSSPELDELCLIAREAGAVGARLTGAGFGGCIVALVDRTGVDAVVDALVADYFRPRRMSDRLPDRVFVAVPSDGASVSIVG